MKKFLLLLLLTTVISTSVQAAGFSGQTAKTSVNEAMKLPDNEYVTIQGNITKKLSSDKYLFKDSTGTITVEIDNDKWGGIDVKETDILELTGEIERKFNSIKLDVDTVKKISK